MKDKDRAVVHAGSWIRFIANRDEVRAEADVVMAGVPCKGDLVRLNVGSSIDGSYRVADVMWLTDGSVPGVQVQLA